VLTQEVPEQKTLPPESRRLDIQGLRAVAIVLVVAFHAGLPVRGGFIGVDVFIVISGFVITGMLMRELESTGTIRFRDFYSRRIKRLLPALALLTTTVVAFSMILESPFGPQVQTAKTGLAATFLSANLFLLRIGSGYFSLGSAANPLLHTWALSVEEQVYLVFPALLLGAWIVGRRFLRASKRGALIMLVLVAASSFPLCLLASFGWISIPGVGDGGRFAFYSSVTRIWEFAAGAALALVAPSLKRISPKLAQVTGIAGACTIGVGAFALSGATPYPGIAVLLPVFGAAAIITSGFHPSAQVPRLLGIKPMARIGDLSYSWYLWHWPLVVFGAILWPTSSWILVVLAAASLLPAWVSTVFLEDPIRRSRAIKGRRLIALAAICVIIPTADCLVLEAGARASWGSEAVAYMRHQVGPKHLASRNHCDDAESNGTSIDEPACNWNRLAKGPHVYLVGNSVAAQYSEALIGASYWVGSPLTIDTTHGCFFFDTQADAPGQAAHRACSDTFAATVDRLVQQEPGVVVMASTWDLGVYGAESPAMAEQKSQFLVSSLTEAASRLRDAGHQVIIVLPTPRFFHGLVPGTFVASPGTSVSRQEAHANLLWRPSDCWNVVALNDPANCGATVPEAQVEASQLTTVEALTKVAETTGSTTLDLRAHFCSEGACRTNVGNRWAFQDGIHITVGESETLTPVFAKLLGQVALEAWVSSRANPQRGAREDAHPADAQNPSPAQRSGVRPGQHGFADPPRPLP